MAVKKSMFMVVLAVMVMVFAALAQEPERDRAEGNRLIVNGQSLFASGMNIAWSHGQAFGQEVGDTPMDINAFTTHIRNIRREGGNAVRWWLHTDASHCPKINNQGQVTGIGTRTIQNIRSALDVAHEHGVMVTLCLFSFDLLVPDGKGWAPGYNLENNHQFLTVPENIDTYINNALIPILNEVGNHPAVMAWEVFNEAEGMLQAENWSHVTRKISFDDILRITNQIAGVVRRETNKMVSTGIKDASYLQASNARGFYSTEALVAAGGDNDGWLDFYMVHYYPQWQGTSLSPFHNPASFWDADRPIVIAEFPGRDWGPGTGYRETLVANHPYVDSEALARLDAAAMTVPDAFRYAFNNGYAGALSWALTDPGFGTIAETGPALQYLYDNHKDVIMIKDVKIEDLEGDLVMRLAITDLPVLTEDWSELSHNPNPPLSFTGRNNITFEMFVQEGSGTNLDINVVIKVGGGWTWTEGPTLRLADYEQGEWHTVTVPVSDFGSGLTDVRQVLFQYGATGTPYSGVIFFDNVRLDSDVISDFDDAQAWSLSADNSAVSIVTRASVGGTVSISNSRPSTHRTPLMSVRGRRGTLELNITGADVQTVELFNLRGAKIATLHNSGRLTAGTHRFAVKGVARQVAFVRVTSVDNRMVMLPVRIQ
ncbi:MAG: hypothetical protein LBU70_11330 [Chitinispirillales bacterium]|jgi:hypothetical protein|nr:hypothetical protein [Chitinispirillales bacterium]